ncbi:MAG: hypothetical protein EOP48_02840 [Sphingobacteriales bacterium]|nr:MAG: hypothetical protein EOP48_02840 [Sphingobacteriales bacterium]
MDHNSDLPVVVFANRKDFFLTKICISSIRFYYPDVEIFLVKDFLNGPFNTDRFCKVYRVKEIKMGTRYFGWAAAKVHFLLNTSIAKRRYLCIDSDIIFLGRVLERFRDINADFILHPEYTNDEKSQSSKDTYLDIDAIKQLYPDYYYPGFYFNTGQTVVTPGLVDHHLLTPGFIPSKYPFYVNRSFFPCADQSVLNAALPNLLNTGLKVEVLPFMQWSVFFFQHEKNSKLQAFLDGNFGHLVHYAGDVRVVNLNKMRGSELLYFHQNNYRLKLNFIERLLDKLQDQVLSNSFINRLYYIKNKVYIKYIVKTHL